MFWSLKIIFNNTENKIKLKTTSYSLFYNQRDQCSEMKVICAILHLVLWALGKLAHYNTKWRLSAIIYFLLRIMHISTSLSIQNVFPVFVTSQETYMFEERF